MGWLLGLPLGLVRMLGGLLMLLVRMGLPILVIVLLIWFWRRSRKGPKTQKGPDFDGPVYTVDYEVVEEEESDDGDEKKE